MYEITILQAEIRHLPIYLMLKVNVPRCKLELIAWIKMNDATH